MGIVGDQVVPFLARDPHGKRIGIERGPAGHGQDLAVARVHGDDRAILAFQRLFGGDLQVQVDGQLERFAGDGRRFVEAPFLFAAAVHNRPALPVRAHQQIVILQLHAGFAHHVAGIIELPLGTVEHILADLADIADQVRHEAVLRDRAADGT